MPERNDFCPQGEWPPSNLEVLYQVWTAATGCLLLQTNASWQDNAWRIVQDPENPFPLNITILNRGETSEGYIRRSLSWTFIDEEEDCIDGSFKYFENIDCTYLGVDAGGYPSEGCCKTPTVYRSSEINIQSGGVAIPFYIPPSVYPQCNVDQPDCSCSTINLDTGDINPPPNTNSNGNCGCISTQPVRYATGEIIISSQDISSPGFGVPWGHSRNFLNRLPGNQNLGQGYNWQVEQWPYLVRNYAGDVAVLGRPQDSLWFDKINDEYVARYNLRQQLELDATNELFVLTELDGTTIEFDEYTGMFRKLTAPGGMTIEVTQMSSTAYNFTEVERTYASGGSTITEQLAYTFQTMYGDRLLTAVTLRRKVDAGAWTNVEKVEYAYYGPNEEFGNTEDLKTATTYLWEKSDWTDTGTSYYRYYRAFPYTGSSSSSSTVAQGSSSSSGEETPDTRAHLLMYVVNPHSYQRLKDDPTVADPLTAPNSTVALYADYYFDYDDDKKVNKELVKGGAQTYLFDYSESSFADGYNSWKTKTTETLPDGSKNVVYSNYAGQTMLTILQNGTDEWATFYRYNSTGRMIWQASPAVVTGYDENKADLLDYNSGTGKYTYLRDNDGLIETKAYDASSGYVSQEAIQKGQLGTSIKLREYDYTPCPGEGSGSSSSSSSSSTPTGDVWKTSKLTEYPSNTDQTQKIVTTYDYTWYTDTCQVEQKTTTLPVISTAQNGAGTSNTRKEYFDTYGNNTWNMDERGFITQVKFDIPTGAVTQLIQDVDTSVETDHPTGWATPSGGGLNLVTDFEHDDRGRMTQSLGPSHEIDLGGTATTIRRASWIVYDENPSENITRTAQGYATGSGPNYTYTLVNPVSIAKRDKSGKPTEEIQATRSSASGKLLPSDTFAQSTYTRWKTYQYTGCCLLTSERSYHDIPTSGDGASGTNYDQTYFGYDVMRRRVRKETPGGTVLRSVYDARGLTLSSWMGTDDTGATSSDPAGGGATGNNMVVLTENEYDGDTDGGNSNLTKQTQYADGTDSRVTTYTYDFRSRRTETDGEIDYFQKTTYDNRNLVTKTERYDTTSSGNLISRNETKFDDLGRTYQQIQYGVNPSTGTVGNSLTSNTWYDAAGHTIKSLPAGSKLFTKTTFDSLGRKTRQYVGYDLDETSYADASTVVGDTILEQSESTYNDASSVVQVINRQRYHDAPASQTGELKNPSTTPKARVTYVAQYADGIGRNAAIANYGTNGGTALSRSSTIPTRSDDILVNSQSYDDAGNSNAMTDADGLVTEMEFDNLGRETKKTMNPSTASSSTSGGDCQPSDDTNIVVSTTYNADGNVSTLTAENSVTGNQTTEYVYGTTLSDSDVASSLLKRKEIYPDSVDSSDVILFSYNRQRQQASVTDQNGTVHSFDYDKLGRMSQDRVTTVGTNVDGAIRRIAMTYEVRGMREKLTSYDNATVGAGSVVNEVQFAYNDFSQLTHDYQAHGGAVNTSTTPKVQYGYATGSDNTIRATTMTYPDGRVLTYDYGTASGIDDSASRVASLVDDDMSSTHLVDYSYLGVGKPAKSLQSPIGMGFVIADQTEPDVKWTLVDLNGTNDPDTGDIYSGLDRFGRVKDNRWYDYDSLVDADRIKYGYDRAGNRIWRQNTVADALSKHFDELYDYDDIQRLKSLDRGTLNGNKDGVTDESFAECWSLDPTGNWKKFLEDSNGNGTWDLNQSRTANSVNEITDITESAGSSWVTPAYSKAGNMTTIPQPADMTASYTATYDAWNRLVKLEDDSTSNTVAEYEYDGAKRRGVQKNFSSGTLDETRHVFFTQPSRWQAIEERVDSSSDPNRQFIWGLRYIDEIVLRDRDTTGNGTLDERLYACQDANWNVIALTNTAGDVQERFAYSAYGTPLFLNASFVPQLNSASDWETLFAGYRYDDLTGLSCVRNRYLDNQIGIWLQRDPIGYQDGVNLYQYYFAINTTDPSGQRSPWPVGGRPTVRNRWFGPCDMINSEEVQCLGFLLGWFDAVAGLVLPPHISNIISAIDCLFDVLNTLARSCAPFDCSVNESRNSVLSVFTSINSCALNLIQIRWLSQLRDISNLQRRVMDLIFTLYEFAFEFSEEIALEGQGTPTGLEACNHVIESWGDYFQRNF